MTINTIKTGKYKHFKGSFYQVLHLARHSETEEMMVVYHPLYTNEQGDSELWVRPLSMFDETIERDGQSFKRFVYVGSL